MCMSIIFSSDNSVLCFFRFMFDAHNNTEFRILSGCINKSVQAIFWLSLQNKQKIKFHTFFAFFYDIPKAYRNTIVFNLISFQKDRSTVSVRCRDTNKYIHVCLNILFTIQYKYFKKKSKWCSSPCWQISSYNSINIIIGYFWTSLLICEHTIIFFESVGINAPLSSQWHWAHFTFWLTLHRVVVLWIQLLIFCSQLNVIFRDDLLIDWFNLFDNLKHTI